MFLHQINQLSLNLPFVILHDSCRAVSSPMGLINSKVVLFCYAVSHTLSPSLSFCLSSEVCRSLGSALKDKCLTDLKQGSNSVMPSSEQDGGLMMSVTMEHFLLLFPPLLSSLCCHHSRASGKKTRRKCFLYSHSLQQHQQHTFVPNITLLISVCQQSLSLKLDFIKLI